MKQVPIYQYHPQFIFRTPSLPFQKEKAGKETFFKYTQQAFFKEAIYLASPVLYEELVKWHTGNIKEEKDVEKLITSLYKYYTRMQTRCTPYGLFAACSWGNWGNENKIILNNNSIRHTRLDMNYLCALAQQLSTHPALVPLLKFYPNNSIYVVGENLRYVEYHYLHNKRIHQISSVDNNIYLQQVLEKAKQGASIEMLINALIINEIEQEEAAVYIKDLITSQLLVSELEPAITGEEFIHQLIDTLHAINKKANNNDVHAIIQLLSNAQEQIKNLDRISGNDIIHYREIFEQLKTLNTTIEENQLFQTDFYKTASTALLNNSLQDRLTEAIEFLNKFSLNDESPNLKKFKENFYAQYEDAEVSLLQAIDTETGVGLKGKDTIGINTLLDDLYIPPKGQATYQLDWNKQQQLLHDKLMIAFKNKEYTVVFTDEDLKDFNNRSTALPDSLTIMFRMIDDTKIYLQNSGGSSAANLLGRFAHGDDTIHQIINDITKHEQHLNENRILAEIVHLPESRIGNILLRPAFRDYEIPYLGKSALPLEKQIPLEDLMVSVKQNKIILRSKKLNKEIIPRLSSAHNFSYNALPVYQFLCDMQTQQFEKQSFWFNWGTLSSGYKFLPRAAYKNIIFNRAKWQLNKNDFKILLDHQIENYIAVIREWRKDNQIPQYIILAEGDNELFVDLEDLLSLKMFVQTIKKRDRIVIEEFLFDPDHLFIKDLEGNGYTNECIAILLKNKIKENTVPKTQQQKQVEEETTQRNFSIGSEWLYYKFYCGVKTTDKLLTEIIKPLTEELQTKQLIDQFFFIRYTDPDLHIRLRFHIINTANIGKIISIVNQHIQHFLTEGLITKMQTDTYKREIERYGNNSIAMAESFFHVDSIVTLNLLDLIEGENGEQIRWQFAIRSIDELLTNFNYTPNEKLLLLEQLKTGFIHEHSEAKELKVQLDVKFRNVRKQVEDILDRDKDGERNILPLIELLAWKAEELAPIIKQLLELKDKNLLQLPINELMASYIHMMLNRIFKARQRTYEMLLYDLLYRFYKTTLAKEKSKEKDKIMTII